MTSHDLYSEMATLHRYFLDWRFRILNRMYVVVAAAGTATVWLVESSVYERYAWIPPAMAGAAAVGAVLMDVRSMIITRALEYRARDVEACVGAEGPYSALHRTRWSGFLYTLVLCGTYVVVAVIGYVLATELRTGAVFSGA